MTALAVVACESAEPKPPEYAPREVVELARWTIRSEGQELGALVRFEIRDPSGPVPFYRVLDRAGRWVGHADANGRFSRRVPFQETEQDLGVWSLARGCAELFEASGPVDLEAVPIEADARKR